MIGSAEKIWNAGPGSWSRRDGGARNYCEIGQHFTTGPTWIYVEKAEPLKALVCVCERCAEEV